MAALGDISKERSGVFRREVALALVIPAWPNISFARPAGGSYSAPIIGDCEVVVLNDSIMDILTL